MQCDSQSLVNAAQCLNCNIPPGIQNNIIIYLLCQIVNNGGTGGGGATQVFANNYAGGVPTDTPTTSGAVGIDTSNGAIWYYYSGAWH